MDRPFFQQLFYAIDLHKISHFGRRSLTSVHVTVSKSTELNMNITGFEI